MDLPMSEASTPLMRQYNGIKQQVPNALLMFRLGDFYELFFEDAVVAARELEITLTSRNKEKGAAIPMCGVPFHAAEGYISRLIQKGYRVAICDQVEDPKSAKGLVKREIMRVVTPGTAMDATLVRSRENNFLAAVCGNAARAVSGNAARSAVAHVDVSTGEFKVTEMEPSEVAGALEQLGAREVLFPTDLPLLIGEERAGPRFVRTELENWVFTQDYADRTLRDHFKLLSLDGCGLAGRPAAVGAAGAILHYLRDTQRAALDHLDRPTYYDRADSMVLDAVTVRNLELLEPIFAAVPASGAPASASCGPPWTAPKSNSASTPLANCASKPSCAPNCASTSPPSSISNACSPKSPPARLARGTSSPSAARWKKSPRSNAASTPSRLPACATCTTGSTNSPTSPISSSKPSPTNRRSTWWMACLLYTS